MSAKPLHAWVCLDPDCEASGLTTVTTSDVTGEARKHVDETTHSVHVAARPTPAT